MRKLATYVADAQAEDGGWALRSLPAGNTHPIFCLYPTIALIGAASAGMVDLPLFQDTLTSLRGYLQRYLDGSSGDAPAQLLAMYIAMRLFDYLPEEGMAELLAAARSRVEHRIWHKGRLILEPKTVASEAQPLWHVTQNKPAYYLVVRRFWPPLHPISAVLGSLLVDTFDRETTGWRNDDETGPIFSWTTALSLLASYTLSADLVRHGVDPHAWLQRAAQFKQPNGFDFDVVVSFSGQQREVAERIRKRLTGAGLRVFYDKDFQHELLGEELTDYLHRIYFERSRYAVAIISSAFVDSKWGGNWEWKAILARMADSKESYLLPYFWEEDVDIAGLRSSIAYASSKNYTPEEFADLVIKKLLAERGNSAATP